MPTSNQRWKQRCSIPGALGHDCFQRVFVVSPRSILVREKQTPAAFYLDTGKEELAMGPPAAVRNDLELVYY